MSGRRDGSMYERSKYFVRRYDWIDKLKPGDVVLFKSGALRTVLEVTHRTHNPKRLLCAMFTILHCSWTKRPYTSLERSDIAQRAQCVTRARVNLAKHPAALLAIADSHIRGFDANGEPNRVATCCDVIGVFE